MNFRHPWGINNLYLQYKKSDHDSSFKIRIDQEESLRKLIEYASSKVTHYKGYGDVARRKIECGTYDLLAYLPILTKEDIRRAGDTMRVPSSKNLHKALTGGTTGAPLTVYKSYQSIVKSSALYWRGFWRFGITPTHKAVLIKGFKKGSWKGNLRMRILRKWTLPAMQTGLISDAYATNVIQRVRPIYIEGYVTDLLSIPKKPILRQCGIKRIFTTGEKLYSSQRKALEQKFNAKVSTYYGCNEINSIAFECEKGSLHVNDEHVIVEAVDDSGNQVWDIPGRILVTDLDNYAMPFIRYEVGDIGVISSKHCNCGRKSTVISEVEGRSQDKIINNNGDFITALYLESRFRNFMALGSLQFLQVKPGEADILIAKGSGVNNKELQQLKEEIYRLLGQGFKLKECYVKEIPITIRGKRLLIDGIK